MKKNIFDFLGILILVFFSFIIFLPLLRSGFWVNHDAVSPVRLLEMETCFADGQFPCRWTPDLGGGFGLPLFNFYPPLFYFLTMIPRVLGVSFVASFKIIVFFLFVFSALSVFLLLKEFFGNLVSLVGAVFYLFAPFHSVEVYVRGDLTEATAIFLLPFIFWSFYRLAKDKSWFFFLTSTLSLAAFLISHNVQVLAVTPIIIFWIMYLFFRSKAKKELFLAFGLTCGLAAFFLLPAYVEKNLVNVKNLTEGYFDFRAHFVGWKQLFLERSWGYGVSVWGPVDGHSFQIGWPQWWPILLTPFLFIYSSPSRNSQIVRSSDSDKSPASADFSSDEVHAKSQYLRSWSFKKNLRSSKSFYVLFSLWLGVLFLTTNRSIFIWERIPLLNFFQFPWRFLGLATFLTVLLSAFILQSLISWKKILGRAVCIFLLILTVVLNIAYFKPLKMYPLSDEEIRGSFLQEQRWASSFDYLPLTVKEIPDFDFSQPRFLGISENQAKVEKFFKKSDYFETEVEVFNKEGGNLIIPVFDFPRWEVFVDQNLKVENYLEQATLLANPWGLLEVKLGQGKHQVTGWFRDTKVRESANLISLASLFLFLLSLANWERVRKCDE